MTPRAAVFQKVGFYKGINPSVRKITKLYRAGTSVARKAMREIEERLDRKPGLESWFIKITPPPQME